MSDGFERVFALLDEALNGMHDVAAPPATLPSNLPQPLIELYAYCDGVRMFLDTIEIRAAAEVERDDNGRWIFATIDEAPIAIDAKGKIWRDDDSLDAAICEGTSLERWMAGLIDATAMLYDGDGEFAEDLFDEDGDLLPIIAEKQQRAQLKRDAKATAPRWRLAQILLGQDTPESTKLAQQQLEELVANDPAFAWGWLELAKISERAANLPNALDEVSAAADAAKGHDQEGYFWAQVARIAAKAGDEATRAIAAAHVTKLAPDLKAAQLAGAKAQLAEGDADSARGLVDLLRAVWPRDLEVLDLAKQLDLKIN